VNHTSGNQKILLMDQTGKVIKTIYWGYLIEGEHRFNLDGDNLPDGIYFIMYHGDVTSSVKKMIKW
jgi:flagellar hook assembly protein FlgD